MNIDERIQIERESLEIAIMPSERREHAEKLASLEKEKFWIDILKPNCVMEENYIS
jgi:hypothetical protein